MQNDSLFRFRFDNVEFDEAQAALLVDGQAVPIEPRPLQVLAELLHHPNEVVTREELLDSVWADQVTVEHVLTSAVNKLRKALGATAGARIVTLPRIGYRFAGPLERVVARPPSPTTAPLDTGDALPGRRAFRLEQRLGGSDHIAVWTARHAALRQVHVFKLTSSAEGLRALKREYTLLRLLRSELGPTADLAPLLDANFVESPYFLECDYVGPDLLRWSLDQPHLAAMTVTERLALFLPLARTVAAAHGVGVLHKDIKPANVLIAGQPGEWRPLLADFGSGHAADPERLRKLGVTAMGLTVNVGPDAQLLQGTAMYLAPEVVAGGTATAQSDLFALGVVLYQLLAGDLRRPLAPGWHHDVEDPLLRQDIAAATDGEPARRLGSVREWVDRLSALDARRADHAEAEKRERELLQLRAAARERAVRRPWVAATLVTLAIGLAVALFLFGRAREAVAEARTESARSAAIGQFLHEDVLQAQDVLSLGSRTRAEQLLATMRKAAEKAGQRFAGDPQAEAALRRRLAESYLQRAALIDAGRELERARALLEPVVSPTDSELLIVRLLQARLQIWRSQPAQGLAELEAVERLAGVERLAAASELSMAAARARYEYAGSREDYPGTLHWAQRLIAIADARGGKGSLASIDARQRLADAFSRLGDQEAAHATIMELTRPPFSVSTAESEFYSRVHIGLAAQAAASGQWDEAKRRLHVARDWALKPGEARNDFNIAWIQFELGMLALARGEFRLGLDELQQARSLFARTVGEEHQYVISVHVYEALLLSHEGRIDEADERWSVVEDMSQRAFGRRIWTPVVDFSRAVALAEQRRCEDALRLIARVNVEEVNRLMGWKTVSPRIEFARASCSLADRRAESLREMRTALTAMAGLPNHWPWLVQRYTERLRAEEARQPQRLPRVSTSRS